MGMGFAPTWLRQLSPPPASQNHFNHWLEYRETRNLRSHEKKTSFWPGNDRAFPREKAIFGASLDGRNSGPGNGVPAYFNPWSLTDNYQWPCIWWFSSTASSNPKVKLPWVEQVAVGSVFCHHIIIVIA